MASVEFILRKTVSFQQFFWKDCIDFTLLESLKIIQSNHLKEVTERLRVFLEGEDYESYSVNKRTLPGVTFCGNFDRKRTKYNLLNYNDLLILDIDKLTDEEIKKIKNDLENDEFVFCFWESPSQKGIKGLVYLTWDFDIMENGLDLSHKLAFKKFSNYFKVKYKIDLDQSGSDYTRLCFLSWDPAIRIKSDIVPFLVKYEPTIQTERKNPKKTSFKKEPTKDLLYNPLGKNKHKDKITIKNIIKFLRKNRLSITYSYDEWMRVGMAIANSFTYDLGKKYFLELSQMDQDKFNESECEQMLLSCYYNSQGKISFNTITFFAEQKGFVLKANTGSS